MTIAEIFCTPDAVRTYVQRLQTVPAESVLAVFTHHLGTSLISLYVHFTFWTAFDGRVVIVGLKERTVKTKKDKVKECIRNRYKYYLVIK